MNLQNFLILFTSIVSLITIPVTSSYITEQANLDKVTNLPGLSTNINISQYSGYLPISNEKNIHYWMIESESDSDNDPVVFWTNGGPGCSGLLGLLTEQGPFKPNASGVLEMNKWRWNKIANMVFVEQPVGVGYSYSTNTDDYKIGDDQAAKDNLQLVLSFLERFPKYKSNPLYISSESYGGHYMPTWAKQIVEYNKNKFTEPKINFKGFLVGNPYVDYYSGSGAEMEALWARQMIPKPSWDKYVDQNCTSLFGLINNSACYTMMLDFMHMTSNSNPYALDYPTCVTAQQSWMSDFIYDRFKMNNKLLDYQRQAHPGIPLKEDYQPCEENYASAYMNRMDVKKALHVNTQIVWDECSNTVKYKKADIMNSVVYLYKELINDKEANLNILIYSGDDDGVCATQYTSYIVFDVLNYIPSSYWKLWKVDGQTAGYITQFFTPWSKKSRFAYSTVHFAGHEVPTYKPKEAYILFESFINGALNKLS